MKPFNCQSCYSISVSIKYLWKNVHFTFKKLTEIKLILEYILVDELHKKKLKDAMQDVCNTIVYRS